MRAALLLLLAGCASAPTSELRSLDAHATILALPGPGPHRGYVLIGRAVAAQVSGLPARLQGSGGSARLLPGRSRSKGVGDVLHFAAAVTEKDFKACVGDDPNVAIVFDGGTVASGRVSIGRDFVGALGDFDPVWE